MPGALPSGLPQPASGTPALLVPIKAFSQAKQRLAAELTSEQRAQLARAMANHVIRIAQPLEVFVICGSQEVKDWAQQQNIAVLDDAGAGLNEAVDLGMNHLRQLGFGQAIIAHADLPLATGFGQLAEAGENNEIVLVPDRHGTGTNVLSLPVGCGFEFAYGAGSFERHLAEAQRLSQTTGLKVTVLQDQGLAWDVDEPADLLPEILAKLLPQG